MGGRQLRVASSSLANWFDNHEYTFIKNTVCVLQLLRTLVLHQVLSLLPVHEIPYRQELDAERVCSTRLRGKNKLELSVEVNNFHKVPLKRAASIFQYCRMPCLKNVHI